MMAVQFQHQACAGFLLKCGADPNLRDVVGNTALHLAVLSCSPKVVELLLDHNANLDAKNKEGFTPLSLAVSKGQVETAEFLLRMGADVHARDQQQRTPLMMAASVGKMKLIQVLLHYGADISHEDTHGRTADDYACIYGYPSLSEQLSESAAPKKAEAARAGVEDFSKGGLKRSEKKGIGDGWSASAEQLDFTPKKQQEPKVTRCMKAFQQGRKTSSLPPVEEVEEAEDFLWASPWDSEEKAPEQHGKEEKKEVAVELEHAIAGCIKKYLLNGSPDEPNTTCSKNPGEHSGSTCHVSSPAKKRSLKEATDSSGVQEALAEFQSERHLFHQLLEDMQEQQLIQGRAVTVSQEWFNDIFHKLSAAAEKQVYMLEEMNKELKADCTDLREQIYKYEADKVKSEGNVRELQQELGEALKKLSVAEASLEVATKRCRNLEEANLGLEKELGEAKSKGNVRELQQELGEALKKLSVAEASLEVATKRCRNLEEANLGLEKELGEAKSKCREVEKQQLQYEHQIYHCMSSGKDRERKLREKSQKLKDLLSSPSETRARVKELEERVHCLSVENARLEGTVQQQKHMIEALEGTLQASASACQHLQDLITSLRAAQAAAEEQHQQQLQKQVVLSVPSKDLHSMRTERLKPGLHPEDHGSPLGRRKNEFLKQCESDRKKEKKLKELNCSVRVHLDRELETNKEVEKESERLDGFSRITQIIKENEEKMSLRDLKKEMQDGYSEVVNEFGKINTKLDELFWKLEADREKTKLRLSELRCESWGGTRNNWRSPNSSCMQRSRQLPRTDWNRAEPMTTMQRESCCSAGLETLNKNWTVKGDPEGEHCSKSKI
ncbi:ankyrin repeat domain-containing protein 18A-like [Heliangelus exortis]|uniref:ankyrin repeat domain-containing protein 18A-like n=1 Tax=Heliangelus exortis TaxID=472823 RepID=UPI003A8FAAA8